MFECHLLKTEVRNQFFEFSVEISESYLCLELVIDAAAEKSNGYFCRRSGGNSYCGCIGLISDMMELNALVWQLRL
jgi:hypothetical protein